MYLHSYLLWPSLPKVVNLLAKLKRNVATNNILRTVEGQFYMGRLSGYGEGDNFSSLSVTVSLGTQLMTDIWMVAGDRPWLLLRVGLNFTSTVHCNGWIGFLHRWAHPVSLAALCLNYPVSIILVFVLFNSCRGNHCIKVQTIWKSAVQ